jgi:hypothetical protein
MKQGGCMNASRCKRWAASNKEDQPTYVLCKSSHEPQAHIFSSPANSSWDSTPVSAQACKGPAPLSLNANTVANHPNPSQRYIFIPRLPVPTTTSALEHLTSQNLAFYVLPQSGVRLGMAQKLHSTFTSKPCPANRHLQLNASQQW